ncbi:RNA-binding S4 domain-containing protein [Paraglaciecola aestuariivivens]
MQSIQIHSQPIALYQLLKFEALVASGGEAKMLIEQGRIKVNGEVETRKRKKIMAGDKIEFDQQQYQVTLG